MESEAIQLIHDVQRQAREYAAMGRDFPLYGVGSLFEMLESLEEFLTTSERGDRAPD